MAHTKAQKSVKGNRDSAGRRLGVKIYGNQKVKVGNIIIRQRGMVFKSAEGTRVGNDFTIYAIKDGKVEFLKKQGRQYVMVV